MTTYLIPVYLLGFLVVLLGVFVLLSRIRGGRYLRPIVNGLAKIPFMRRMMLKASKAALEKQNPELASAINKMERAGVHRDPQKAQVALSRLTAAERKAYLAAAGEQQEQTDVPAAVNRQQRRQMERLQKGRGPSPQRRRG